MTVLWGRFEDRLPEAPADRPHIILNAAMTLDGKIATQTRDSKISSEIDLDRLHQLRASVDAVLVGVETVLADDPELTVRRVEGKDPDRVIVDSEARTPAGARLFKATAGRTIIAVTAGAPEERVDALLHAGAEIIVSGSGDKVDLRLLMSRLRSMGIRRLLVEGGGNVNWSLVELGLVDEIHVAVAPIIVGGREAVTLVEGRGFSKVSEGFKLSLLRVELLGEDLVLTYRPLTAGVE
ncbi:2,5-diamino-6-(ribosylamino)-4(3H)-pyrimidinone 5'-phosphate reductase [Candidatus Bathyarchaeota archaeon]|nr:2,5-diamino-6-(ribosylamino)-4(3H)-pyrimidinone 5'-phosphate reductase [Candidatus Bathyarchaeota archaeon]